MERGDKKRKGKRKMKGKKYIVTATSYTVYTVEVTALTKEHAMEKAGLMDGSEWTENKLSGDWQIESAREIKK